MSKPILNNHYWIATENYGVLKATYKEVGDKKIGYFQCALTDGYMVLMNGIRAYKPRNEDELEKPALPSDLFDKESWTSLGWIR